MFIHKFYHTNEFPNTSNFVIKNTICIIIIMIKGIFNSFWCLISSVMKQCCSCLIIIRPQITSLILVKGFMTINLKLGFQNLNHLEITGILSSSSAVDVSISSTTSSSSFVGTMKKNPRHPFKMLICVKVVNVSLHFCKFVYIPLIMG